MHWVIPSIGHFKPFHVVLYIILGCYFGTLFWDKLLIGPKHVFSQFAS